MYVCFRELLEPSNWIGTAIMQRPTKESCDTYAPRRYSSSSLWRPWK